MMNRYEQRARIARRLDRQFDSLGRSLPILAGPLRVSRARGWWMVRLPIGILLVFGGIFSILPFLAFWMLPVGLLLIAVDLPVLRGPVSASLIRGRRKWALWRRKRRR